MILRPSAAALYWFLKAEHEVSYENQEELARLVRIPYGTLKDGLKELRSLGLVERTGKSIKLRSEHNSSKK